jgi:tetratricopeptide (TPR) repeat protein
MNGISAMSTPLQSDRSMALVHEGWNHLKCQRPLAAWGCWQRALRADPLSAAASKALSALESAHDLPMAARTGYRFREAADPVRRAAWNERMHGRDLENVEDAADVFGRLAANQPSDSAAWFNRALCLAWVGKNVEAIGCLDRVVSLDAEHAHAWEQAVEAWTLAEVLRQGAGAEVLADDLRFACTLPWMPGDTPWLLDEFPAINRVPTPVAPGAPPDKGADIAVFEWLDTSEADPASSRRRVSAPPLVLASVYISKQSLRLSSPRLENLERIEETFFPRLELAVGAIRREASPLPLPFLDADVWIFRIPPDIDPEVADALSREAVEQYFENQWIHRPRHGLDDRSPLAAARAASRGDTVARAKLTAVVRLREQLGNRPSALLLYQGYPFDRLRRRLGLELFYASAVDLQDLACASEQELDRLDPTTLDDARLVEAAASAAGFRDDARTSRLAAELLRRRPAALAALDLTSIVSSLVRRALARDDIDEAASRLKEARSLADGPTATTLDTWLAEVYARSGNPDLAMEIFLRLIESETTGALRSLDAAETMLDNGHLDQAKVLLRAATDRARNENRKWIERRATALLATLS